MEGSRVVTIADVARRAGVAPSTVSYVLSNRRSISPATRRVVEQAIEELDYRPHAGARALRGARTRVLALSGHWVPGPYQSTSGRFVHELSQAARAHDHDLLLLGEEGEDGLRRVAGSRLADGVVLMSVRTDEPRVPVLRSTGLPAALIGRPGDPRGVPWCDFDFEEAGGLAVRELVKAGHRTIAFLAATDGEFRAGMNYAPRCLAGVRAAAREAGIRLVVARASDARSTLTRRLRNLLSGEPWPTALVTHHQISMLTALLRQVGFEVPHDVSVVMVGTTSRDVDELPVARLPLPVREMTSTAVQLALAAVERAASGSPWSPTGEYRLIPPRLIRGRSLAAPPSTAATRTTRSA